MASFLAHSPSASSQQGAQGIFIPLQREVRICSGLAQARWLHVGPPTHGINRKLSSACWFSWRPTQNLLRAQRLSCLSVRSESKLGHLSRT